jgi:hypothetical protein
MVITQSVWDGEAASAHGISRAKFQIPCYLKKKEKKIRLKMMQPEPDSSFYMVNQNFYFFFAI